MKDTNLKIYRLYVDYFVKDVSPFASEFLVLLLNQVNGANKRAITQTPSP